jgi:MFS family permease
MQPDATTKPLPAGAVAPAVAVANAAGSRRQRRWELGRAFWRLFAANGVSAWGDGLVIVAFPLLALTMTSKPVVIAGVAVAGRLPAFLGSLPAGALVDRVDRRRLVLGVNLVRILVLAAFAATVLAGRDSLPVLYATVFVLGTGDMIFNVATQACLPAMVPASRLPTANGYLTTAEASGEQFVGPAMGGLAFGLFAALPFIADAASFVISTILIRNALPVTVVGRDRSPLLSDIREGVAWFLRNRLVRLLAVVVASLAFCQAMVFAELVLYGTRQLRLGEVGYGVFFACVALGNVAGALWAGRIHARLGPARTLLGAALLAAASYLVLSMTTAVPTATAVLFLEAVGVAAGNVTTLSLRQQVIPSRLLGRVGGAFRLLIFGLVPLGALAGGLVTAALGVQAAFRLAGLLQLVVLVVAAPALTQRIRQSQRSQPREARG